MDSTDLDLARDTITQLADELDKQAAQADQDANDARMRATALRGALDMLPTTDTATSPFATRIAGE